ncbi:Metal tolerance protein 7 [Aphelenchoides bicaudatus]|nr:Metal tolerance protein 7 [Aphelenchoides bicaudatus]
MADQDQEPLKEPDGVPTVENRPRRRSIWSFLRLPFGKAHRVDKFYRQQSDLLENYEQDKCQIRVENNRRSLRISSCEDDVPNGVNEQDENDAAEPIFSTVILTCNIETDKQKEQRISRVHLLSKVTLLINVSLTIAKFVASYLSGSLSIISSLVDSLVDITSGVVIWATSRAITKTDPYQYPVGRARLEPIALTIVSVIMAVASVQMIVQSLESIVNFRIDPHVDLPTLFIMISTICVKFLLFLICRKFKEDPSIQVLEQDHRNDCLSNSVALICAFCAQRFWIYLDPLGAICVSLYIAITWYFTGKEQLVRLSGKSAKPEFINRIIKICIDHDERINYIDTVYVYHFGTRFLVEVHVVMDEDMHLKEAHDIAETLQNNIESLPDVERAFVHADYDFEHKASDEHKNPVV